MDGLTATELRAQIKENAVVAFPNYVGKIQALGVKQSTFLIIVTYESGGLDTQPALATRLSRVSNK
ncbi:hypothetical protein LTR27_000184 [Elasticomyces elasticus]|nr:hypothetical protein LTR27_000184 [Elasticomyces elasticus]